VIPQRVLDRPPSAELRPDQTDQDSLPPYDLLDAILQGLRGGRPFGGGVDRGGFRSATVERVARLVIVNEYKRRQAAPGVRITPRAFGRDRRYPITSGFRRSAVKPLRCGCISCSNALNTLGLPATMLPDFMKSLPPTKSLTNPPASCTSSAPAAISHFQADLPVGVQPAGRDVGQIQRGRAGPANFHALAEQAVEELR
jgi:hypothetical protein